MGVESEDEIDTTNEFLVCATGDRFRLLNIQLAARGFNEEQGLRLAAWLVAVTGRGGVERFSQILNAVMKT